MTLYDPTLWTLSGELRGGGGCRLPCRCPGPAICWGRRGKKAQMNVPAFASDLSSVFLCSLDLEYTSEAAHRQERNPPPRFLPKAFSSARLKFQGPGKTQSWHYQSQDGSGGFAVLRAHLGSSEVVTQQSRPFWLIRA